MKSLRQLSAAVVLTFAIALSVSAGDMDAPITAPQTGQTSAAEATSGDISAGVTLVAVSLIQGLLELI